MDWKNLADSLVDTIKERGKKFWDENEEAQKFVTKKAEELAKLLWKMKTSSSESEKEDLKHEVAIVKQTIENELTAVALHGEAQAKSVFLEVVNSAFTALVKAAPILLAAL